jgi:hypothetical protein
VSFTTTASNLRGTLLKLEGAQEAPTNIHQPLTRLDVPGDSAIAGRRSSIAREILGILGVTPDAKVRPTVVELVAVDVVRLPTVAPLKT